jgi:hypothetical protein
MSATEFCGTAELKPGDRVRCTTHPELTGKVRCHEWNKPGVLSAIPYNIDWDDTSLAFKLLGMFAVYASDETVELAPVLPTEEKP